MEKILCLIHANCQGLELENLLSASRHFSRTFRIERYTNYTRENIPESSLAECGLFLYQYIGPQWGELSSGTLLGKLPSTSPSLQIPNMLFTAYWPFWTQRGPMDEFNDKFINRLMDEGLPKHEIVRRYMSGDILDSLDVEAALERSLAIERTKEQTAYVKTVDFIMERWKSKLLFHTINHPCAELLLHAARGILEAIGIPPLTEEELAPLRSERTFPSYADFDLPIHPQVAKYHGLQFISPGQSFAVFGRKLSFEQYIGSYIDCRLAGKEHQYLDWLRRQR